MRRHCLLLYKLQAFIDNLTRYKKRMILLISPRRTCASIAKFSTFRFSRSIAPNCKLLMQYAASQIYNHGNNHTASATAQLRPKRPTHFRNVSKTKHLASARRPPCITAVRQYAIKNILRSCKSENCTMLS